MRKELEIIEKIEAYLEGSLSPEETRQFETQLANDPALKLQVELQRQLMMGIDRAQLKDQVRTAKKNYMLRRNFLRWGLGGLVAVALVAAVLYNKHHSTSLDTSSEHYQDSRLPNQAFMINPDKDTVIATPKGIIMSISAHTFLDEDNQPVTGPIQLVVKEALDPASIMKAGLSTRSGDQLLATGGMFYIDAQKDGHTLHIDTTHPILTQIPDVSGTGDMQLYKGRRTADGTIDWTDPRPFEHFLVPVDIMSLNFYPPGYLDSLRSWGYDATNRQFTDSLYYSLAAEFSPHKMDELPGSDSAVADFFHPCAINPAKIKAIWNDHFQNTILATHEFEERLYWLHRIAKKQDVLDIYVNHLSWALSDIDSLAALQFPHDGEVTQILKMFAARHDGKVNNSSPQLKKLSEYYKTQSKAYSDAIAKTQREYWDHQRQLDEAANKKIDQHTADTIQRNDQNFQQEFEINLKDACRQLGITETIVRTRSYTTSLTNTGWYNVDKAVFASTATRTTLNYTDTSTGKKAVIKYTPASFRIAAWNTYDRINVYLLPDKLSSFMLVAGDSGAYKENLNELMKYDLVCIAYKGDQAFYFHQSDIKAASYSNIPLASITDKDLTDQLNKIGSMTQATDLIKENSFNKFDIPDQKRRKHNESLELLRSRVLQLLFPCISPEAV